FDRTQPHLDRRLIAPKIGEFGVELLEQLVGEFRSVAHRLILPPKRYQVHERLSAPVGRRRAAAAGGGGRGGAAAPDRRGRNARRNRGSRGSPCRRRSGNRARR